MLCFVFFSRNRSQRTLFASASLDGAIVLWSVLTLQPTRRLNQPDVYINQMKMMTCAVSTLLPLDAGRKLAASVGKCVVVFDVASGQLVQRTSDVHESSVHCLLSLDDGARAVTCGGDAVVKVRLFVIFCRC
jgi:WD40 repeat protein